MSSRMSSMFKRHPVLLSLSFAFIMIFCVFGYLFHWAFYNIERIEPGELISEKTSPSGEYTVRTYLNNGGATVSYAVLGVLFSNEKNNDSKHIYWQYEETAGEIHWIDEDTVNINGQKINVPGGKYDYRHP
ncbi:hypothetical protein B0G93_13117 [Bacillus sp. V-88]|uniref:DUF5412 family protein n=1 Tax=Rossellomorea vietnamensis TaxID=218284 RepID=UPI00068EED36|nr:DUF5412 family protein [Rossellomorea vietnamensis]PRX67208.1 hypothetical protein B0G93_13117 [Bacillus sp. V-88]SLK24781.1 hypothetical protein SAMN06295884_13117 [Bacillus sp. V-88]